VNIDVIILSIASLIGFYMAANIGANDLANAMGTAVGSKALDLRQAVIISIIANVLGASLAGGYVTGTISKGIIDPIFLLDAPDKLMIGMFVALLVAGLCVHLATFFGLPVSTTHAIVGAVVGFGIISVGAGAISWHKITGIAASWVISILSFIFKALKNLHLELGFFSTVLLTIPCAAVVALFGRKWIRWQIHLKCELGPNPQGFSPAECLFAQLQILTACYIAFAHGANDVANAVGPVAAIFSVVKTKSVALQVEVPFWMLFIGGIAVGGGLYVFGTRVLETIGKNITEITPIRGFCAQFGAATTILICSRLGLPVSTTHVLVGSVVGVGLMRGMGALDLRILKNIAFSWIITLPVTIFLAMIIYKLLALILL